MNIPYIGITDFTNFRQVEEMLSVFNTKKSVSVQRSLHVGVMMSQKTLNGIETKWSKAFPPNDFIAEIFSSKETMNCLHYADYENINLEENLTKAIAFGGEGINAIQLDMTWPCPRHIENALANNPGKNIEVILQVGKAAIAEARESPKNIVDYLMNYQNIATYVLLDLSLGQGKELNSEFLIPFIDAITDWTKFNVSVAGGLGPNEEDMNLLKPIIEKYPQVSFDAQGKLRKSRNALDPIEWDLAEKYLIRSLELVR